MIVLVTLVGTFQWASELTREVRALRAELPADQSVELDELRRQVEELRERVERVEASVEDADAAATDVQEAVDEVRSDLIALTSILMR